jgi:hypothetical protein
MKIYSDLVEAVINGGAWGVIDAKFPIALRVGDRVKIRGSGQTFIPTRAITIKDEVEFCVAIKNGDLREAEHDQ